VSEYVLKDAQLSSLGMQLEEKGFFGFETLCALPFGLLFDICK
jgi:hypothetical protein